MLIAPCLCRDSGLEPGSRMMVSGNPEGDLRGLTESLGIKRDGAQNSFHQELYGFGIRRWLDLEWPDLRAGRAKMQKGPRGLPIGAGRGWMPSPNDDTTQPLWSAHNVTLHVNGAHLHLKTTL